jgi:hypothetical protein
VLRFWDHEVIGNIEAVLQQIVEALRDPHPDPLPAREREKRCPRSAGERGKRCSRFAGERGKRCSRFAGEREKRCPRPAGERVRVRGRRG